MDRLSDVQQAIEHLPAKDVRKLILWLRARAAEAWDNQIERDASSGLLDSLVAEADAAIDARRVAKMP
jgi:translation elongation factor EF-Ts